LSKSADLQRKPLDPGLRRDDSAGVSSLSNVIPAQAGIQRRSSLFIK
jgi:hypothetical protein